MPLQRTFLLTGHKTNVFYQIAAKALSQAGAGPESTPRVLFYECAQYFIDTGNDCMVRCL